MKKPVPDLDARIRSKLAAEAGSSTVQAHTDTPTSKAPNAKGDRWQTLNQFVEVVGPRLSLAERWVWVTMFKYAQGGVCLTSVRRLAEGGGLSRSTVEAALRRLVEVKLVWPVWLSHDKSKPSRYGVHPNPSACLGKVLTPHEPSRRSGRMKR